MAKPAAPGLVSTTVTGANQFTPWLKLEQLERAAISVAGSSFVGTVTLQRRLDGSNARGVKAYTADAEETFEADTGCDVRLGVQTGAFTGGSVALLLKKGT